MSAHALLDRELPDVRSGIRKNSDVRRGRRLNSREFSYAWILLLSVAMLTALAGPFLAGHVYTADDLGAFHLPMRAFYADCLARGEPFDWSPQLFCGFYLTGEGQIGGYHPLHLLLYRFLPLGTAFDMECLISYPFMLLGMCLLLRRWRLSRAAALLGGLTFAFSGFSLLHFIHVNAIAVVAHIPWLLLAIDWLVVGRGNRRPNVAGIALALLTASQLLLGYPQYVWLSFVAEIVYVAWLIGWRGLDRREVPVATAPPGAEAFKAGSPGLRLRLQPRPSISKHRIIKPLAIVAAWIGIGVLIGGVQLLPTLDALQHSARQSASSDFSAWGSLDPLNLVQFVAPYLFKARVAGQNTHELGLYAGAVTLILAIYCLTNRPRKALLRRLRWGAAALTAAGLLFAFGEHTPLHWLVAHAPLVGNFRFPCRAIVLVHFGIAILAAIGFASLVSRSRPDDGTSQTVGRTTKPIWFIVAVSTLVAIAGPLAWPEHVANVALIWIGPACIALAASLVSLALRGARWPIAALALLSAVDLASYGLSYAVYRETAPLDRYLASVPIPPGTPDGRVALDLAAPNRPGLHAGNQRLLLGWRRADGYAGLEPANRLDYCQTGALRVAGVAWIAEGADLANRSTLSSAAPGWLRIENPLPRARLITHVIATTDPAGQLSQIPLDSTAMVDQPVELDPGRPGSVEIESDRPGSIWLAVDVPGRQLLVLAERFHEGWQVKNPDGQPVPVLRINGDFMGCVVGQGRNELHFEFRPASLRWGRWLSLLGLGLLGLAAIFSGSGNREISERPR